MVLPVRLSPGAAQDAILGWQLLADGTHHVAIKVRAVAEKGKANKALADYVAKVLGLSKQKVQLLKGQKSRLKQVLIADKSDEIKARIMAWGEGG